MIQTKHEIMGRRSGKIRFRVSGKTISRHERYYLRQYSSSSLGIYRAAACPRRARPQRPRLQPHRLPGSTSQDDAGLGRLPRQVEGQRHRDPVTGKRRRPDWVAAEGAVMTTTKDIDKPSANVDVQERVAGASIGDGAR